MHSQAYGPIFSRGAEPSLPEKFFGRARKTAMLTCKITLPDSPNPVIIGKNPGFRAFYLVRWNEFGFSFSLAAGFCPKNVAFAR